MKKLWFLFACLFSFNLSAGPDPMLIGGRPALKNEFPEIVYIASGGSRCSAVIVSEKVLITAGHCTKEKGSIEPVGFVDFVHEQVIYKGVCYQAPLYRDGIEDHDFAICKLDKRLTIKPAKVDKRPLKVLDTVFLTGYGCTKPDGSGGNDGILRVGSARVNKLPMGSNHWFYTVDKTRLCFGDSGGPAMRSEREKHSVVGINSRGDLKSASLMTALFTSQSIEFMESFAEEHQVDICGITPNC